MSQSDVSGTTHIHTHARESTVKEITQMANCKDKGK